MSSNNVSLWLSKQGISDILNGDNIKRVERELMESRLAEVNNKFLQEFGFEGVFRIEAKTTNPDRKYGTTRVSYRIAADDRRTTAALNRQSGWLNQFLE